MAKDFFKISDLTQQIEGDLRNIQSAGYPTATQATGLTLAAQVRVQLAIAQQLSVISGHLAKLIELCEKQSNK